jgi:limonene-1,2-epoxide hydrolase
MADAESVMREFFAICSRGDVVGAVQRTFHEDVFWSNTGYPDANGLTEAVALMQSFKDAGIHSLTPDFTTIAVDGNKVLVERVEHMQAQDGSTIVHLPVMGTFEIADGKIKALRDYFDPSPFRG